MGEGGGSEEVRREKETTQKTTKSTDKEEIIFRLPENPFLLNVFSLTSGINQGQNILNTFHYQLSMGWSAMV